MKERYNEMRSNTIKVRVLATLLSLAAVFAFLGLEASHNVSHAAAAKSVTVTFSAGLPGSLDMVNRKITATGGLVKNTTKLSKSTNLTLKTRFLLPMSLSLRTSKYGDAFKETQSIWT